MIFIFNHIFVFVYECRWLQKPDVGSLGVIDSCETHSMGSGNHGSLGVTDICKTHSMGTGKHGSLGVTDSYKTHNMGTGNHAQFFSYSICSSKH